MSMKGHEAGVAVWNGVACSDSEQGLGLAAGVPVACVYLCLLFYTAIKHNDVPNAGAVMSTADLPPTIVPLVEL